MNKAIIIGNLGRDPEIKYIPDGTAVCNFSVAVTERYNDKSGNKQEKTEWFNIVVWGKRAETCSKYLKKGSKVAIEGKIETRSWDKDGVKQYKTEINAMNVEFLSSKSETREQMTQPEYAAYGPPVPTEDDDSIPF